MEEGLGSSPFRDGEIGSEGSVMGPRAGILQSRDSNLNLLILGVNETMYIEYSHGLLETISTLVVVIIISKYSF